MTEVAALKKALSEAEDKAGKERTEREKDEAQNAKAEAQKALQEIQAVKKIAAGKAFIMQSKHVKETFFFTYPSSELSRSVRRSTPQCVGCRGVLPGRGGELDGEVVLVSVYWDRTSDALERPAEATG